jgi:hypothetical protein
MLPIFAIVLIIIVIILLIVTIVLIATKSKNSQSSNQNYVVAVGSGNNSIAYSSDNGITWKGADSVNKIFSVSGNGISYNGKRYVAVGSGTSSVAYSDDLINWTSSSTIFTVGNSICWSGTKFIAGGTLPGGSGTIIKTSTDGINWNSTPDISTVLPTIHCVYSDDIMTLVAGTGVGNTPGLVYLNNGVWTYVSGISSLNLQTVHFVKKINSVYYCGGVNSQIAYSLDGINWTPFMENPGKGTGTVKDLYSDSSDDSSDSPVDLSIFVALTDTPTSAFSTTDIASSTYPWIAGVPASLFGVGGVGNTVTWNGTMFIIGGSTQSGETQCIYYSYDGTNWFASALQNSITNCNKWTGTKE